MFRQLTTNIRLASLYDLGIQPTFSSSAKSKKMSEKVRKIVKKGRWIYGDTIQSEVWIIKQTISRAQLPRMKTRLPLILRATATGCFTTQAMFRKAQSRAFQTFAAHLTKPCVWQKAQFRAKSLGTPSHSVPSMSETAIFHQLTSCLSLNPLGLIELPLHPALHIGARSK